MDEFDDITRLLREERPQASELELDEIKRRVRQRVARKGQPMRSRLAILAMLVVGILMSGTGAGLAVQGFDQSGDDASQAQYPNGGGGDVLGEETESGGGGECEVFDRSHGDEPSPQSGRASCVEDVDRCDKFGAKVTTTAAGACRIVGKARWTRKRRRVA